MSRRGFSRRLFLFGAVAGLLVFAPGAAAAPPEVTVTISGTLGLNGWYRSNVTINWQVEGEDTSTGCDTKTLVADTPGFKITCTASSGGDETTKSVTIKLDKTPPAASATADRAPDANGWYRRPLTVASSGSDSTSGLDSCSSAQYGGPDNASATVVGSCRDMAGNATGTALGFKYDSTAPSVAGVTTKRGNRSAEIAWRASSDTSVVEVARAPGRDGAAETVVYRGSAVKFRDTGLSVGRKYRYRVSAIDEATNRSGVSVDFVATGALLSPLPAEKIALKSIPALTWAPVKGAAYYNLQLIRGDKVLSAWPTSTHFRLRRTWRYRGRAHRLRPGVYRWYVWPGYGRISLARYGRMLGSSTFVVTK
jgi:hypothetical protein